MNIECKTCSKSGEVTVAILITIVKLLLVGTGKLYQLC